MKAEQTGCDSSSDLYDVVICGGGLAGQTLARQLKLTLPQLSILILEQEHFPRPLAACKVGESTIETSSFYLGEVLQLSEHLKQEHLRKLGLRYFWSDPHRSLAEVPEIGLSQAAPYPSYQIDRGVLENHLYETNCAMGVVISAGVQVKEICLGDQETLHQIHIESNTRRAGAISLRARWVIDAMGRRKFLQKKLNLRVKSKAVHSAAWFRVKGRLDIADLVSPTQHSWHERVPERKRYYSTTHLMGDGYWVWLIPLSSGHTSVGIVAREPMERLPDFTTLERAMHWLQTHEPALYQQLQGFAVVDFLKLYDYTYSSKQVFSSQRWACIGDAALFSDPFYSPGIALLGYENSMVTKLIEQDRAGRLRNAQVDSFNSFALSINEYDTYFIQAPYLYFKHPHIWSLRLLSTLTISWGTIYPQMFNAIFLDVEKSQQIGQLTRQLAPWLFKLEALFQEWASKTPNRFSFQFIDYLSLPFLRDLYRRSVARYDDFTQVIAHYQAAVQKVEEIIQVIFLLALRDVMPEAIAHLPNPLWLNPLGMSLEPARWQSDGLFRPTTAARDFRELRAEIEALYTFSSADGETGEMITL